MQFALLVLRILCTFFQQQPLLKSQGNHRVLPEHRSQAHIFILVKNCGNPRLI